MVTARKYGGNRVFCSAGTPAGTPEISARPGWLALGFYEIQGTWPKWLTWRDLSIDCTGFIGDFTVPTEFGRHLTAVISCPLTEACIAIFRNRLESHSPSSAIWSNRPLGIPPGNISRRSASSSGLMIAVASGEFAVGRHRNKEARSHVVESFVAEIVTL